MPLKKKYDKKEQLPLENLKPVSFGHVDKGLFKYLKIAILSIGIISILVLPSYGQKTFSLSDLVNYALNENYQIRIVRQEEAIAANNNTLGMAGFLPSVEAVAEATTSTNNTFTRLYSGDTRGGDNAQSKVVNAFVELNWVVFDGMSMFARKDQLDHLERLGALETRFYLEQTVSDLAKAYYHLVTERQLLRNYRESLEISAYRRNLERQKLEIGTGTGLLYRQSMVDFNNDSAMVINQKAVIRSLEIQMNRLINRSLEAEIIPETDEIPLTSLDNDNSLRLMASRTNRDVMSAHLEEMLADARYQEERGRRLPQISLFGNYGYRRQSNEVGITLLNRNFGPQMGIRVRFNLYNGNQQNIRLRNFEIQKEIAGLERDNIALMVEATLLDNLNQHGAVQEQLNLISQSLTSATEALEIARRQLAAGAINGYDFRLTQLALLQVKNNLVGFTNEQKNREIDILRLVGALMDMEM